MRLVFFPMITGILFIIQKTASKSPDFRMIVGKYIQTTIELIDRSLFSHDHRKMKKLEQHIQELGQLIKKQRNQKNLSQTQLAHLAGVSLNLVSQIEAGKPRVQFVKLLQVLQVLGLQLKIELGPANLIIERKLLKNIE